MTEPRRGYTPVDSRDNGGSNVSLDIVQAMLDSLQNLDVTNDQSSVEAQEAFSCLSEIQEQLGFLKEKIFRIKEGANPLLCKVASEAYNILLVAGDESEHLGEELNFINDGINNVPLDQLYADVPRQINPGDPTELVEKKRLVNLVDQMRLAKKSEIISKQILSNIINYRRRQMYLLGMAMKRCVDFMKPAAGEDFARGIVVEVERIAATQNVDMSKVRRGHK